MGSIEIGANRIRGHWFWNRAWGTCCALVLRVQENFKQSLSPFFSWQKRIAFKCYPELHFYTLIIGFFRSAKVLLRIVTPRLVFMIDYGFDQWSVVNFLIKKLFVYLFMVKQCIYLVIQIYFMQIPFHLSWSGNKFTNFSVFSNCCLSFTQREL